MGINFNHKSWAVIFSHSNSITVNLFDINKEMLRKVQCQVSEKLKVEKLKAEWAWIYTEQV